MNRQNPGIGWCDYTWNAAVGCKGSCGYCYARERATRLPCEKCQTFEPHTHPERLRQPYSLKKPARIFIDSMWDFGRGGISRNYKEQILDVIRENPQHTFQVLTKEPRGYRAFEFPENLWIGTTVTEYDDINNLYYLTNLACGNLKFISFEPLLGTLMPNLVRGQHAAFLRNALSETPYHKGIDWIIIGAQTGPNAVKPEKAWVDELLDAFDGPVFLKDSLLELFPDLEPRREFP